MIKRIHLLTLLTLLFSFSRAQYYTGFNTSSYAGVTGVGFNPAIADNPFIVDINLISMGLAVNNNYIGVDRSTFMNALKGSIVSDSAFQKDHLLERVNGKDKDIFMGAQVQGPLSFMFTFGKGKNKNKNALAFSYNANMVFNVNNLSETLARSAYYGMGYKADSVTNFVGQNLSNSNLAVKTMAWMDYGVTYSRVIYDQGDHFIKLGGTLKLIDGIIGGYLYGNNLNYKWPNYDSVSINNASVKYALSGSATQVAQQISNGNFQAGTFLKNAMSFTYAKPSAAVDLGFVYEWRPDKDKYKYRMDCDDQWDYSKQRYKLSVGFSIIDFGAVKFKQDVTTGSFYANVQNWNVQHLKFPNGLQSFNDTISSRFGYTTTSTAFTMWLPTRFNLYVDYNIAYGFGVNLAGVLSPDMAKDRNMVQDVSTFTLTPKFDHSYVGVYLPLSYDVYGNFNFGATLRLGPLFVGTQDILAFFAKKHIYNEEFHAGIKITIPYHKLRDKDKDGVSNKKDKCPNEPGPCITHGCPDRDSDGVLDKDDWCPDTPGPVELHGCPDSDGDGIIDIMDSCPFEKGLAINHGCPDRDSDGIIDKYDECPDQPGLAQFNGCPDRDSDGVPDKLDWCPDLPGPKEHHGCPDTDKDGVYDDVDQCVLTPGPAENHGCPWPDRDGDGIPDKDDECPDVFGVPENHGCPKLEKKEIETVKYAFENLEFATGKDEIKSKSFFSLNALADLLKKKANYGLRIEGHTDNVGKDESNLILSQKRATAVKNYLVKRGVDGSKLDAFGYGASKPIADNDTPEGRQKNRRVEMKITFH